MSPMFGTQDIHFLLFWELQYLENHLVLNEVRCYDFITG